MNYPSREQAQDMVNCEKVGCVKCKVDGFIWCDSIVNKMEEFGAAFLEMYADIDRLTAENTQKMEYIRNLNRELTDARALVPKAVVPKIDAKENHFYICSCNNTVGIVAIDRENGDVGGYQYKYCPKCGSRMDWDKVEVER